MKDHDIFIVTTSIWMTDALLWTGLRSPLLLCPWTSTSVCCTDELAERGRVKRETQGHPAKVPISCPVPINI